MKEQLECPICKNNQSEDLFTRKVEYPEGNLGAHLLDINFVRNKMLFDDILRSKKSIDFHFKICCCCGLIFFSPRCEENDLAIKYKITSELGDVDEREKVLYVKTFDNKRAFEISKIISKFHDITNSIVMDVGGTHGLNLKIFLPKNTCYVVDYVKTELIAKVHYLCKTVNEIPESFRCFAVLYCHTLEHVADPVQSLIKIKNVMEPNGILYIEVPLGCWREYQNTKNFITHINFFSEGSLWHLLDQCNFNIKYLKAEPVLERSGYGLVIRAVAENASPHNRKNNGYQITRRQMSGQHFFIRLRRRLLNKLLKEVK